MDDFMFPMIITLLFASAAFCGWHQARDKRRSGVWPFVCFCFPPVVLVLMALPQADKVERAGIRHHGRAGAPGLDRLRSVR